MNVRDRSFSGPRYRALTASLTLIVLLVVACTGTPTPTPSPAVVRIAGASAMAPALSALSDAYQVQHPAVTVIIEPSNTYQGMARVLAGEADLALSSLTPSGDVWSAPLALGGIAIVVHPENSLESLTLTQVHDVFGGQTWRWEDLGIAGAQDEIGVVSREAGSGTRAAFEMLAMARRNTNEPCQPALAVEPDVGRVQVKGCDTDPVTPTAVVMPGSADVVAYVAAHPGAIGYVGQGYLSLQVKAVRIEGVSLTPERIREGEYPLVQPLYLLALEEPTDAARSFIDFCLSSEGQAIVAREYVPVR